MFTLSFLFTDKYTDYYRISVLSAGLLLSVYYVYLRTYYGMIPSFLNKCPPIVHQRLIYRRGFHNYYLMEGKIKDEKEMVEILLKNIKK